jgi:hypothetical protein
MQSDRHISKGEMECVHNKVPLVEQCADEAVVERKLRVMILRTKRTLHQVPFDQLR